MTGGVPDGFWIASAAAFGAVVGSFLNVCIYRMPRRCMTIAYPRHSRCPKCGHGIRWFENIPVLSWLALRGRCSQCRNPISPIYPFIEALTAGVFAMSALFALDSQFPAAMFAIAAYFSASLIVATFVDFEFQIIPDQVSITGAILAPIVSFAFPAMHRHPIWWPGRSPLPIPTLFPDAHLQGLAASFLGAVVGAGTIWLVGVAGKIAFRKEAMGFGDVKLMAFVGGFLGWIYVLFVFLIACLLGSVVGLTQAFAVKVANLFRKEPAKFDHYLAFGPYLAVGALAMFFFGSDLVELLLAKYPHFLQSLAEARAASR